VLISLRGDLLDFNKYHINRELKKEIENKCVKNLYVFENKFKNFKKIPNISIIYPKNIPIF